MDIIIGRDMVIRSFVTGIVPILFSWTTVSFFSMSVLSCALPQDASIPQASASVKMRYFIEVLIKLIPLSKDKENND